MQPLPHEYVVTASGAAMGDVTLESASVPPITSEPPKEFGGSGTQWSPESLLVSAIADCFILSFRGIARASKLEWQDLKCEVTGTLAQVERTTKFTQYQIHASLTLPPDSDTAKGERLLHKAENICLITNSLNGTVSLTTEVHTAP